MSRAGPLDPLTVGGIKHAVVGTLVMMTISLGGAGEGPLNGGMTAMGGRIFLEPNGFASSRFVVALPAGS